MSEDPVNLKWAEFKDEVKKVWPNLDDDALGATNGDLTAIGQLVQEKYELGKDELSLKLDEIRAAFRRRMVAEDRQDNEFSARVEPGEVNEHLKDQYRQF